MNIIQIFKAFQACTNARDFFAKGGTPKACADQFLASINQTASNSPQKKALT
jgi:hypothetical protein